MQHQQLPQWDQAVHSQAPQERAAPSVLLGLVQATPPQTPPSEVEAPPNCRERGQTSSRTPFVVQNTFLNMPPARSPSLEPFYKERLVKSSPPSGPNSGPPSGAQTPIPYSTYESNPRIPHWLRRPEDGRHAIEPGFAAVAAAARLHREFGSEDHSSQPGSGSDRLADVAGQQKTILSQACPEWHGRAETHQLGMDGDLPVALGTPECPSIGSQLHRVGACKPCAFVLSEKEGCKNGVECQFCHLCEPGEKKRRKKERLMIRREARQEQRKQRQMSSMGWRSP